MLPWQPFDVVKSILLHIAPAEVSIVWLAGLYLIYQTSGVSTAGPGRAQALPKMFRAHV